MVFKSAKFPSSFSVVRSPHQQHPSRMSCFCHKLLTRQYHSITQSEVSRRPNFFCLRSLKLIYSKAEILRRTWSEAPQLFQADPPPPPIENPVVQARGKRPASGSAPRARKHPRTLSDSLIPDRPRDQPSQVFSTPPLSSTAIDLVETYSYQIAARILGRGDRLDIQQGSGSGGVFARIFLAIERSDQKIEIQQLFRRACCYAFAQLHKKGTSVDPIVQEIENELPLAQDTRQKVYHIFRIGTKWVAIVEQFASIVNRASQQLTGLLCLLGSPSV
jgi:hypothetical protein